MKRAGVWSSVLVFSVLLIRESIAQPIPVCQTDVDCGDRQSCSDFFTVKLCAPSLSAMSRLTGPPILPNPLLVFTSQVATHFSPLEATLSIRAVYVATISAYTAWVAYQPSASHVVQPCKIPLLPPSLRTERGKKIAISYAYYRSIVSLVPRSLEAFVFTMRSVLFLDPSDDSLDLSTAAGIGNTAARDTLRWASTDGFNSLGDLDRQGLPRKYNRQPFEDYTGYRPMNDPFTPPVAPTRWKPLVEMQSAQGGGTREGYFVVQTHITPQAGKGRPFAVNVENFVAPPIYEECGKGDGCKDMLRQNIRELLTETRGLNDEKKMLSEWFDNKLSSLGSLLGQLAVLYEMNLDEMIIYELVQSSALYDAAVVAFGQKIAHDNVRPKTAIADLFGEEEVEAYVPGVGVRSVRGFDWEPYFRTMPHSEYPSGSACLCTAFTEASQLIMGDLPPSVLSTRWRKGSSKVEAGTPKQDVFKTWSSWEEIATTCRISRLWSGVHFSKSVAEGYGGSLCRGVAAAVMDRVKNLTAVDFSLEGRARTDIFATSASGIANDLADLVERDGFSQPSLGIPGIALPSPGESAGSATSLLRGVVQQVDTPVISALSRSPLLNRQQTP